MKSIKMKMMAGYLSVITLILFIGISTIINLNNNISTNKQVMNNELRLMELTQEMSESIMIRTIVARGYILYGDETYAEQFAELTEDALETEKELKNMIGHTAEFQEASELSKKWRTLITDRVVPTYQSGDYEETIRIMEEYCQDWSVEASDAWRNLSNKYNSEFMLALEDEIYQAQNEVKQKAIMTTIAILLALFVSNFTSNQITKPLKISIEKLTKIANKDLTGKPLELKTKDEVNQLACAANDLQANLIEIVKELETKGHEMSAVFEEFMIEEEKSVELSQSLTESIKEISEGSEHLAHVAQEGLEETTVFGEIVDDNNKNIEVIANQITEVNRLKDEGISVLDDLVLKSQSQNKAISNIKEVVENTNKSVTKIKKSSEMINALSEQTNLLALNASIEAARAGEAGRGFAVVAEEIRKLAEESKEFNSEIENVIQQLITISEEAIKTMDEVSDNSQETHQGVTKTSDKFHGISESVENLYNKLKEVETSSETLNENKYKFVELMENLSSISEENSANTENMETQVDEQRNGMSNLTKSSKKLDDVSNSLLKTINSFKIK